MAYKYSLLRVIHFDFNSPEFITFWSNKERYVNLKGDADSSVIQNLKKKDEYKIVIEWRFRFFNDKQVQIGSFITESSFLITYETEGKAYIDIEYMFEDSVTHSRQQLNDLLTNNNLAIVDLGHIEVDPMAVQKVLALINETSN